jgi:hypothetical protein
MSLADLSDRLTHAFAERVEGEKYVCFFGPKEMSISDVAEVLRRIEEGGTETIILLPDKVLAPDVLDPVASRIPSHYEAGAVLEKGLDNPPGWVRRSSDEMMRMATSQVQAARPWRAEAAGVTGSVVVRVAVQGGEVQAARALSGPVLLRDAAVNAALAWKFKVMRTGAKTEESKRMGDAFEKTIGDITVTFK